MPVEKRETIAIDFDGVIHAYSKGWHDGTIYDIPVAGAREAMARLSALFYILIYSTRNYDRMINGDHQENQVAEMEAWLKKHHISYDEIHTQPGKPMCKLFVDDNAYRFEGNWESSWKDVKEMVH
ncbi:MAG: hypothetical protein ACXAC5_03575 [Promethearchaeota archaeon]|jgi:hypothetical protein